MERSLTWTVLAIGVLGLLGTAALTTPRSGRAGEASDATPGRTVCGIAAGFVAAALALPFLIWLATLPSTPPFATGGSWGQGFAGGGLVALLSTLVALRGLNEAAHSAQVTPGEVEARQRLAVTAPLFGALIAASVVFLFSPSSLPDALNGVSMGWLAVSSLLWLGVREAAVSRVTTNAMAGAVVMGAAFAAVLCLCAVLGVYRDAAAVGAVSNAARGAHAAAALALGAGVPLALFCGALAASLAPPRPQSTLSGPRVLTTLFGVTVMLGLGYLLATRLLNAMRGFYSVEIGLLTGLLMAWTARFSLPVGSDHDDEPTQSTLETPSCLPLLVVFSGFLASYQMWQGFGAGLMLLAAWPLAVSSSSEPIDSNENDGAPARRAAGEAAMQAVVGALFFATILLASRVFDTRFRDVVRVAFPSDQHALFGLLAGALLPAWGAPLLAHRGAAGSLLDWLRWMAVGAVMLLVPGALVLLWGVRPLPSLFSGLALCAGSYAIFGAPRRVAGGDESGSLLALGVALLLVQWTGRWLPLAEASRGQRLHWMLWGAAVGIFALLAVAVGSHVWQRRRAASSSLAGEKP